MTEICEHCSNLSSLRQCGIKNGNLKFQGIAKYVNCFGKRYFFAYAIDIHRYPSGCWIVSGVTMGHPHQTTNKWVEPPTLEMKVVVGCTTLFNRSCELTNNIFSTFCPVQCGPVFLSWVSLFMVDHHFCRLNAYLFWSFLNYLVLEPQEACFSMVKTRF